MPVMESTRLAWFGIRPLIGAEVLADRGALLDGTHAADILDLLEQRGVLVFPQVHFSDDEQAAFTRTLGSSVGDTACDAPRPVSAELDGEACAENLKASYFWHFDGYFNAEPILASVMCAKVVSPVGGNTEFANTSAAWDDLPEDRKRRIDGLRVVHAFAGSQRSVEPEPSYATFCQWQQVPRRDLPLVWAHRSGRKSLVVGNTTVGISGMDPLDSLDLLVFLRDWATQERFCYSHKWSEGDMVMWDNTGTLHRTAPFPADSGRRLHCTRLAGDEPLG